MIASANSLYDTRRRSLPGPAMVREPTGARTVSTDAIPAPSDSGPNDDNDELRKLGERIAELAARINSAEARMMTLVAEFDRRGGWKDGGYSSCAEWLAWRTGTKIGTARERVRTARALERLPRTADALKHGTISYAKVRALTRVATPEREAELLEFARAGSAAKLERTVRMWKKLSRDAELTAEQARHRSRTFSVFVDGDGMYVVKGRLEPEAGAMLMRAVEAASDALFRREGDAPDAGESGVRREAGDARPEPKQRRADAVGLLAERALAAGFGAVTDRDAGRSIENAFAPETPSVDEGRASPNGDGQASPNGEGRASQRRRTLRWQSFIPRRSVDCTPRRVRHPSRALPGHGPLRRGDARGRRRARDARIWTGFAFPRRRRGAWRAMRRWWRWSTRRTRRW